MGYSILVLQMATFIVIYILFLENVVSGLFYDELMSNCHGLPFQCMMSKFTKLNSNYNPKPTSGSGFTANKFQSLNQQQQSVPNNNGQNYNSGFVPGSLGINPADMSAIVKKQGKNDSPFSIKSSMKMSPFNPGSGGGQPVGNGPFGSSGDGNLKKINGMMGGMGNDQGNSGMSGLSGMMGMSGGSNSMAGAAYGKTQTTGSGSSSMLSNCDKDWMHCPQQCIKTNPILGCPICSCKKESENLGINAQKNGNMLGSSYHGGQQNGLLTSTAEPSNDLQCALLPDNCPGNCVEFNKYGCLTCGCAPKPNLTMCPHFPDCPRGYVKMDNNGCPICTYQTSTNKDGDKETSMDWYKNIWSK